MPARPQRHPLAGDDAPDHDRPIPRRTLAACSGQATSSLLEGGGPGPQADRTADAASRSVEAGGGEDGSVATEYGLLAVVAATIVSVMLDWATSGGITSLLTSIMDRVSSIVGL